MQRIHHSTISIPVLFLLVFVNTAAVAHQQKYATTNISINERTGNLEVVHRFLVHDAEHVVKQLFSHTADFNHQPETQQAFADYVIEHFQLKLNDQSFPIETVGFESDEKFFWVYQEIVKPPTIVTISMNQSALHEIWPRQINLVNVEGFRKVKSVEFRKGETWKSIDLNQ